MFFAETDLEAGGILTTMKDKAKAMLAKGEAYARCLKDKAVSLAGQGKDLFNDKIGSKIGVHLDEEDFEDDYLF